MDELTDKQKKFVAVYEGNATEAARLAGYKGSDETLRQVGSENLTKPHILSLIQNRNNKEINKMIATREERQQFWSSIMRNEQSEMRDRLKASELLGKSQADFTEKVEHSGSLASKLSDEELDEKIKQLQHSMSNSAKLNNGEKVEV
jgi:phage terminase small subunit